MDASPTGTAPSTYVDANSCADAAPCTPQRRRGAALERAIFTAVWAELAEVGYAKLTMERVAARAHTSKPVLYRRWSGRVELVIAAMSYGVPSMDELPDTGHVRTDVIELLRRLESRFDDLPAGTVRGLMFEVLRSPEAREIREYVLHEKQCDVMLRTVLERAAARGEVDPARITPRVLSVPKALIRNEYFNGSEHVPESVIVEIVDVFLRLLRRI